VLKGITDPVTLYRLTLPAEPRHGQGGVALTKCHTA
jgi:hypothetical protein